jgi:hypothetical protein
MSNPQQSLYSDSKIRKKFEDIQIVLELNGTWYWEVRYLNGEYKYSDNYYKNAADAEQDLITFLKNSIL